RQSLLLPGPDAGHARRHRGRELCGVSHLDPRGLGAPRRRAPVRRKGLDRPRGLAQNAGIASGRTSRATAATGGSMTISLKVNGATHTVPAEPDAPLLYVLRNDLALNGAKFGCGLAQCGACTVLVDGQPVRSCVTPIGTIGQSEVTTIEGLGSVEKPHPL